MRVFRDECARSAEFPHFRADLWPVLHPSGVHSDRDSAADCPRPWLVSLGHHRDDQSVRWSVLSLSIDASARVVKPVDWIPARRWVGVASDGDRQAHAGLSVSGARARRRLRRQVRRRERRRTALRQVCEPVPGGPDLRDRRRISPARAAQKQQSLAPSGK